jgi:hypothetical protein
VQSFGNGTFQQKEPKGGEEKVNKNTRFMQPFGNGTFKQQSNQKEEKKERRKTRVQIRTNL